MPCLYVDNNDVLSLTKIDDVVIFGTSDMTVFWISGASEAMGINSKGWYIVDLTDPNNPVITPLESNTYDYELSGTVTYVGLDRPGGQYTEGVDATFALLNSKVVGAITE